MTLAYFGDEESGYYDYNTNTDMPTDRYYYDGQMGFEDDSTFTVNEEIKTTISRYGLGARGIDRVEVTPPGAASTYGYPLYDGHGNMRATLARSGSSYTTGDWKTYDVWGFVRSGGGGPNQKYCANLGHVSDNETGLIYMRARYYEPGTGRFVSEDPGKHGWNWYSYCSNSPTNMVDVDGKVPVFIASIAVALLEGLISGLIDMGVQYLTTGSIEWGEVGMAVATGLLGGLLGHFIRMSKYLLKTPLHAEAWSSGSGRFSVYFAKCLGLGSGNYMPFFRAFMSSGIGSMMFALLYAMYVSQYINDIYAE